MLNELVLGRAINDRSGGRRDASANGWNDMFGFLRSWFSGRTA